jgi:hypothetical protein|tara:strand:- start:703 stop:1032 length:330 start_codon:yes stop_codon:yes gene_type:complete
MICANEAIKLKLIRLKYFGFKFLKIIRERRLSRAPLKLRKKVGLKNDPKIILVTKTLIIETHIPILKSNLNIVYKIIIFAIPGFTPGIGLGKKNSTSDNAIAIADSLAI